MERPRVTYCGNVHATDSIDDWVRAVETYVQPIAEKVRASGRDFGLGTYWPRPVARELVSSELARERVRAALDRLDLSVWTANAFPYDAFHAEAVKCDVYSPDWRDPSRLDYTLEVAESLARFGPPGEPVSISTLPLGYRDGDRRVADLPQAERDAFADGLLAAADGLERIGDRTGADIRLAIEPEPFCLLERVDQTVAFLESEVFGRGASRFGADEHMLRKRLGVCVDLCHLEVVSEDALDAVALCDRHGVTIPKVQVSSCLELREESGMESLLAFAEPRYLHQTVASNGERALDLVEVRQRSRRFLEGLPVRSHFHLPLYWDRIGALGSTRASVERFLAEVPSSVSLLEVETYTWSVLGEEFQQQGGLVEGLLRELDFVHGILGAGH